MYKKKYLGPQNLEALSHGPGSSCFGPALHAYDVSLYSRVRLTILCIKKIDNFMLVFSFFKLYFYINLSIFLVWLKKIRLYLIFTILLV